MYDPDGKYGTAEMTAAMLGAAQHPDRAAIGAVAGISRRQISASGLKRKKRRLPAPVLSPDFGLTLKTLADELQNPSFAPDQIARLRAQILSGIEDARQDTGGTGGAGAQAGNRPSLRLFTRKATRSGRRLWTKRGSNQVADPRRSAVVLPRLLPPRYDCFGRGRRCQNRRCRASSHGRLRRLAKPSAPAPQISIPNVGLPAKAPRR